MPGETIGATAGSPRPVRLSRLLLEDGMPKESFSYVRRWQSELDARGWWHSFDLPDGTHIEGVNPIDSQKRRIRQFPIPEDLHGARVLDIGAWDGWFTFEMERRGADVVAVDNWDNARFRQIHAALRSHADYRIMDVYDLTPASVGRFDIVLFMGVLYHLKHPLLALERVCSITAGLAAVDSFILQEKLRPGEKVPDRPIMEFFENEEFGGQADNWCAPNLACLMAMCRTAGFARVGHLATLELSACLACYRKWEPVTRPSGKPPELLFVAHHTDFGINFYTHRDEYVTVNFRAEGKFRMQDIFPEAGGYGARPMHLAEKGKGVWEAKFKLPPGLRPGWHEVTIRVGNSPSSNPQLIAVDFPEPPGGVSITGACDGTTWRPGEISVSRGSVLSVWVAGLPENADRANVRAALGGRRLAVVFIEPVGGNSSRQIHVELPEGAPAGELPLEVNGSEPFAIQVLP